MADVTETVKHQSQASYKGFCWFFGLGTVFVVVSLLLMALFLL